MAKTKKKKKKLSTLSLLVITLTFAVFVSGVISFALYYYTEQLSLRLVGDTHMELNLNSIYEEEGFIAIKSGKDASDKVKIKGTVDTSTPGVYELTYVMWPLKLTREVTVTDEMNPVIELNDTDVKQTAVLGAEYTDPGCKATDDKGNDITASVEIENNDFTADFAHSGKNKIKYTVTDYAGRTTQITRDVKVEPNTENYGRAGLPICMYHYIYDEDKPDEYKINGNYISVQDLSEEMAWLNDAGFYYPTWDEVAKYVRGELILPERSIVLTFDDCSKSFQDYGPDLAAEYKIPITSFMITSKNGQKAEGLKSKYVTVQSHSDNMHRGGGNMGHGGIFTSLSDEEALADLNRSIQITGSSDAFAYPFGDYIEHCGELVEEAGFKVAVTTEVGKAHPGDNPYRLPRVRMAEGQSLQWFKEAVSPMAQVED